MDFIGNKKTIELLSRSLKNKSLGHAYIFTGPERVGKFTLAKMFALHAIKGDEFSLEADNFDKEALLDLIVVTPEIVEKNNIFKQRDISIETIRDAKLSLSLFPYHGKYKILIVDDAHKLNIASQNALLKLLEEPNQTTIIILVTHEPDKILPTIFSRCQVVNFGLVGEDDLQAVFSNESRNFAAAAIGRPGLAKILAQDEQQANFSLETQGQLEVILHGSLNEKLNLAEQLSKDIMKTLERINLWLWEIRKKAATTDDLEMRRLYEMMEKIEQSAASLKRTNANARLLLETLFMDL